MTIPKLVICAAFFTALISGCAGPSSGDRATSGPTPSGDQAPADPSMTMITLSDLGYRPSTISSKAGAPMMLMLVNRGAKTHGFTVSAVVSDLHIDDLSMPAQSSSLSATSPSVSVTVPAGNETDVTFVPTTPGSYSLSADGIPAGSLVVSS